MKLQFGAAVLSLMFCLLLAGPAPAPAQDQAKLKAEVQAVFDQAAAAFEKRDAKAVLATSAKGATISHRNAKPQKMELWAKGLARELSDWRNVSSKFVIDKVRALGKGQAEVVYNERHQFARASDPGHSHVIAARFRAVLTQTPQGWRFLRFQEIKSQFLRDGKAALPGPAPQKP